MPGLAGAARTNPGRHRVLLRRPRQGLEPVLGLLGAAAPRSTDGRARLGAQLGTADQPGGRPHRACPPERGDHRHRVLSRRGGAPPAAVARGSRGGHPLHHLSRVPREAGPLHLGHARGRPPVPSRGRRRLAGACRSSLRRLPDGRGRCCSDSTGSDAFARFRGEHEDDGPEERRASSWSPPAAGSSTASMPSASCPPSSWDRCSWSWRWPDSAAVFSARAVSAPGTCCRMCCSRDIWPCGSPESTALLGRPLLAAFGAHTERARHLDPPSSRG